MAQSIITDEVVLLVEDDEVQVKFTTNMLQQQGARVVSARTLQEARGCLRQEDISLVLLDLHLPDGTGMELMAYLQKQAPDVPVIMLTFDATVRNAVKAMRLGAVDFLEKPYSIEDLNISIERAMQMDALRRENRQLRRTAAVSTPFVVGNSDAMRKVWKLAESAAAVDSTVLILGENGTGKDKLAMAIHSLSRRKKGAFIPIHCGGFSESAMEDQLFGHEPQTLSDSRSLRRGDFELADHGTIFLDDIGELPLRVQSNLLRVIEQHSFYRMGGERLVTVDTRIIAATNVDLEELVRAGQFRQDLFYRLNVLLVRMPPLRERWEDIPQLVATFLRELGKPLGKQKIRISSGALQLLMAYTWPGNILQLHNVLEWAMILCPGQDILPEHLPPELLGQQSILNDQPDLTTLWERWLDAIPFEMSLDEMMEQVERMSVQRALKLSNGQKKDAAAMLGVSYEHLRHRINKHNIGKDDEIEQRHRA